MPEVKPSGADFEGLIEALHAVRVDFIVVGGAAATALGSGRLTLDLLGELTGGGGYKELLRPGPASRAAPAPRRPVRTRKARGSYRRGPGPRAARGSGGSPATRGTAPHFFSPNPIESGTVRTTWQDSRDTSTVWAQVVPGATSSDPIFVAPGAVPWLLLQVVGAQDGPNGGHSGRSRGVLRPTTFIQRLNTSGGIAPPTGCSLSTDVGKRAFVPYTADYFFYVAERDAYHDN